MLTIYNIARLVTMEPGPGREGALGVIPNAALCIDGDRIAWVGPESELESAFNQLHSGGEGGATRALPVGGATRAPDIDAERSVAMPGLIDTHTHLVHAGWRAEEFTQRARGMTYQAIAAAGGGILSTVRATRQASEEELFTQAMARAMEALGRGTTMMEVKSGYGLDWETERKILRVVKRLQQECPIEFVPTFLGAHVVPEEYRANRERYVAQLCQEMIPAVAEESLAEFCDIFVEEGAFTPDEARTIAAAARTVGLKLRLHVDQFSDGGGGRLAAELGACSADHLDYVSDDGIAAMAKAGVVAGLLPAASCFVHRTTRPPVAKLVQAGVPIAIATDYNPGTAPTLSLFLCGTLAVTQMGCDPDLALLGMTRNAARALGREATHGSLAVGKQANVILLNCENEYFPLYRFGSVVVNTSICRGEIEWGSHS